MGPHPGCFSADLAEVLPEIDQAMGAELCRQQDQIELIASENIVSLAVLQAQGSILTNKTVEGYPGRRYPGGADFVDVVERLATEVAGEDRWPQNSIRADTQSISFKVCQRSYRAPIGTRGRV